MKYGVWYYSENGWVYWAEYNTSEEANAEAESMRRDSGYTARVRVENILWQKG